MSKKGVSLKRFQMFEGWLKKVKGIHDVELGGISELSHKKIAFGLEKWGRPVRLVNTHMRRYVVSQLKGSFSLEDLPTKAQFIRAAEDAILEVIVSRIENKGGDLSSVWASKPLTKRYAARKLRLYGKKPMGRASEALLRDLQKEAAFAIAKGMR